jgi:hypothetical protein
MSTGVFSAECRQEKKQYRRRQIYEYVVCKPTYSLAGILSKLLNYRKHYVTQPFGGAVDRCFFVDRFVKPVDIKTNPLTGHTIQTGIRTTLSDRQYSKWNIDRITTRNLLYLQSWVGWRTQTNVRSTWRSHTSDHPFDPHHSVLRVHDVASQPAHRASARIVSTYT